MQTEVALQVEFFTLFSFDEVGYATEEEKSPGMSKDVQGTSHEIRQTPETNY